MPKYLAIASYTSEGLRGLLQDGGSARKRVVQDLASQLGGTVESIYYAFGDDDLFIIGDFPDEASAAAVSLTVGASGAVSVRLVQLLTPEQIDEAAQKAVQYRPPGS